MGEDNYRTATCDRKSENSLSTMSSCSEADSESTCAGGDVTPEEDVEQELEYGPGIVNKLKTRFLTITLKQNRGATNMRRSCSLENILDQKPSFRDNAKLTQKEFFTEGESTDEKMKTFSPWGNLKRAKSMDTLLMNFEEKSEQCLTQKWNNVDTEGKTSKEPKVIKRKDGPLNRSTVIISDEEFPKPDTVKTYKRMFEPAESKRGSVNSNVRRKPPVLRASAKSVTSSASKSALQAPAKLNGVISPPAQQASNDTKTTSSNEKSNLSAKSPNSIPKEKNTLTNGQKFDSALEDHQIKKEVWALNRKNVKKENISRGCDSVICNGVQADGIRESNKKKEELPFKRNVRVAKYLEGTNLKPKIPPNKPTVQRPKTVIHKVCETKITERNKDFLTAKETGKFISSLKKPVNYAINKQINGVQNENLNDLKHSKTNGVLIEESKEITHVQQNGSLKPVLKNKLIPDTLIKSLNEEKRNDNKNCETNNNCPLNNNSTSSQSCDLNSIIKEKETCLQNGFNSSDNSELKIEKRLDIKHSKCDTPVKDLPSVAASSHPPQKVTSSGSTTMVFDFRGKDVVSHLAVLPTPFGCKAMHPKKRAVLIDGKESVPDTNGFAISDGEDDDDEHMDFSTPPPSGVVFEGENVRVGKGAILSTRNKELKIQFDEDIVKNTFVYPSESSLLEEGEVNGTESEESPTENSFVNNTAKLKANTAIGSSGVGDLTTYTPSVLRTVDNFEPGMFRPPPAPVLPPIKDEKKKGTRKKGETQNEEEENESGSGEDQEAEDEDEMLKPADPEFISSWSLSASTSDLLF